MGEGLSAEIGTGHIHYWLPVPAYRTEHGETSRCHCGATNPPAAEPPPSIGDTCCGKCPGDTCYMDQVTGA